MSLYDNWAILDPDGDLISYVNARSAAWYVERDLAEYVSEDPPEIQLNFFPKGKGRKDDPFYLTPRKNQCVVCGSKERLTRHHVVPQFFRKHFPIHLKASANHDVLAACEPCHRAYCMFEEEFKAQLADEFGLDMKGRPKGFSKRILKAAAIIRILQSKKDLSLFGKVNLGKRLKLLFDEIDEDTIQMIAETIRSEKEMNLGKAIVSQLDEDGLIELSKRWRHHFLTSMDPQFLPKYWDPDREKP